MATRLDVPYTRQIDGWIRGPPTNVQERFLQEEFTGWHRQHTLPSSSLLHSNTSRSVASVSSMTSPLLHQPAASTSPPSLCFSTDQTTTSISDSVSTGLIYQGQLASYSLLEEVDGVLVQPFTGISTPEYSCVFWFLNCDYLSRDRGEWKGHCLSHFRGEDPPSSVICPLCDWEMSSDVASHAWNCKMEHLAEQHFSLGQSLSTSRPDFHLFHHLWQKRLIDDEDLKELKGGNHNLTRPPENFVRTYGRGPRRERERNMERQRLQHVPRGPLRHV